MTDNARRPGPTPATWLLLAVNVAMLLLLEITGGSENILNLLRFGAKYGPAIAEGEYWRLITPIFLHIGFFHLIANSVGLFIFGRIVETLFGTRNFVGIYLLSGVFGNIASYAAGPTVGAGASGSVFGIVGAFGAYLYQNRQSLGPTERNSIGGLALLVVINLVFGFSVGGVDNWAHLGGLAGGFLLALLLAPRRQIITVDPLGPFGFGAYTRAVLRRASLARWVEAVALSLVAIAFMVWLVGRDYPYPNRLQGVTALGAIHELIESGRLDEAQRRVQDTYQVNRDIGTLAQLALIRGLREAGRGEYESARRDLRAALRYGLGEEDEALARAALRELGG